MEESLIYKIEILQLLENRYGIEIKDEEIEYIVTFADLIKLIQQKEVNNGSRLQYMETRSGLSGMDE